MCHSCPVCSRLFACMSHLQRHSITRSELKPCVKAFKRASYLERPSYSRSWWEASLKLFALLSPLPGCLGAGQASGAHSGDRRFQCSHCLLCSKKNTAEAYRVETSICPQCYPRDNGTWDSLKSHTLA